MTKLVNRAKMTTATTGTGTITLGSAVDGYQTFADAGVADADVVRYVIEDGDAWEIGLGTYTASGTTLTRGSIESSNADNPINLSGTALVFLTVAGGDLQHAADMNQGVATTDSPTFAGLTATTADINGGTIDGTTIGGSTPAAGTFSSVTVNGNITVTGTVDGRDVAADGSKLDGIEANAKDDQTITAGAGLTGGGTGDVTISHADTSAQASVNNSGATVIQDVTLDTYGHITALGSATITPALIGAATSAQGTLADSAVQPGDNISTLTNDAGYTTNIGDITGVTAGSGLTGGGTSGSVTVSHADTSTQASVNNTGATFIQDVTLDTYGHVTGLGSATLGLSDFGVTASATELNVLDGITATTTELNKLDGFAGTTDNLNATQFLTGRNAIINGNFDIWQRGTSFSAAGYGADRWVHYVQGASGTVTQSRQAFTVGQTDVPNEPTYFYRIQGSSYTMTQGNVTQKIEDVRTFAGQTVTVSFYAKASAARDIGVRFLQEFDGSTSVSTVASPVSLTTSWQKFTNTVTIPSISGKTVGSNSSLQLAFDIKREAVGSNLNNDSIDIAQVQLEAGSVATPFERRPLGQELALCQRYYETGFARHWSASASANAGYSVSFAETKRAIPSVILSSVSSANAASVRAEGVTATKFDFLATGNGGGEIFFAAAYTADAEI